MRKILVVLLALTFLGCSNVKTWHPMGVKPSRVLAEEWDGTWIYFDVLSYRSITIKVMDESGGVLQVGRVKSNRGDLVLEVAEVYIREAGGWMFASKVEDTSQEVPQYHWCRIQNNLKEIVAWWPNADKFGALVETGKLPGAFADGDVELGALSGKNYQLIISEREGVLLNWKEPTVFVRVAD